MTQPKIPVRAEMYVRNGEWNILVHAPDWIVSEVGSRAQRPGHKLWIHNYGGGMGQHSFLIGTIPIPKPKRWWRRG